MTEDISQLLKEATDEVLSCREGHSWGPPKYRFEERDRVVTRWRNCQRCSAVKTASIARTTGEYLAKPTIKYPDGYLVKGVGRVYHSDVRREAIRRVYSHIVKTRRELPSEAKARGRKAG